MEVEAGDPAGMALPRHDALARGQVPHAPGVVITGSDCDGLAGVHSHARNGLGVRCDSAQQPPRLDAGWLRLCQCDMADASLQT